MERFWHLRGYKYVYYRFALEKLCKEHFTSDCLILDAGCGSDGCSLSKVPEDVTVIGVDISRRNVLASKRKLFFRNFFFVVCSVTDLPFRDSVFDLVVSQDVLEHIEAKWETVIETARVCKSRAHFVGSTSNLLNPLMLFDSYLPKKVTYPLIRRFAAPSGIEFYERHSRFTPSKLAQILEKARFKQEYLEFFSLPLFRPWLYQFSDKKPPWFAGFWIAFAKLTNKRPLTLLKEMIVFKCVKA